VLEEAPASGVAQRSGIILYQQARADRVSAALRVTIDLRRMNCSRKLAQLDRAAAEGDMRTVRELEKLHPPNCVVAKGQCCFREDPKLEKALAKIRERTVFGPDEISAPSTSSRNIKHWPPAAGGIRVLTSRMLMGST
jgi:hypothetical protein